MAADYTTTGSTKTIKEVASGDIIDAEIVRFTTKPHGVRAQVVVPLAAFNQGKAGGYIEPIAKSIETALKEGLASHASFTQDVDPQSSLLSDFIDFLVQYEPKDSGHLFATTVRVPISELAHGIAGAPTEALHAAKASLEHTAAL